MRTPLEFADETIGLNYGDPELQGAIDEGQVSADGIRAMLEGTAERVIAELLPGFAAIKEAREEMGRIQTNFSEERGACILTPENMATQDDCTTHEHEEDAVSDDMVEDARETYDAAVERFFEGLGI
jgi:hypothetical protein